MSWFDGSWDYRQLITIDKDQVDSTESDFPVYIDLSDMDSDFWSNVKSDGGDIRITQADGSTQQAVEVVVIDTGTDTGEIHFKASSLSSIADTDFYIYYGNSGASQPAASDTYGSENVWDSDFVLVNHCQDAVSGGTSYDSTSNDNDGTFNSDIADVAGQIESGYQLSGTDDWMNVATPTDMNFTDGYTIEAWLYASNTDGRPIHRYNGKGFFIANLPTGTFGPSWAFASFGTTTGFPTTKNDIGAPNYNTWEYVVGRRDSADECRIFVDGVKDSATDTSTGDIDAGTQFLRFGADQIGATEFSGREDEIRISKTDRSDGWISTTFNNQDSPATFYSVGGEEEPEASSVIIWW